MSKVCIPERPPQWLCTFHCMCLPLSHMWIMREGRQRGEGGFPVFTSSVLLNSTSINAGCNIEGGTWIPPEGPLVGWTSWRTYPPWRKAGLNKQARERDACQNCQLLCLSQWEAGRIHLPNIRPPTLIKARPQKPENFSPPFTKLFFSLLLFLVKKRNTCTGGKRPQCYIIPENQIPRVFSNFLCNANTKHCIAY